MFFPPTTEQFKRTAYAEFEKLQQDSMLGRAWSAIFGREHQLLGLEEAKHGKQVRTRSDVGIQTVAIGSIRGSEGRNRDFDRSWRPLRRVNQERWTSIAVAHLSGVPLPAVDLIKAGDGYFVRDGHHRISVAKHQGQIEIEANVTEWHMADEQGIAALPKPDPARYLNQPSPTPFGQALAFGAVRLSNFIGSLQREINLRAIRLLGRPQKPFNSGTAA